MKENRGFLTRGFAISDICRSQLLATGSVTILARDSGNGVDTPLTVPEGHKHRVTTPGNPRKIPRTPPEPRRDPAEPPQRPRRALGETPAEPSERQISSESLAEGCAPRMVTLRNFRNSSIVQQKVRVPVAALIPESGSCGSGSAFSSRGRGSGVHSLHFGSWAM